MRRVFIINTLQLVGDGLVFQVTVFQHALAGAKKRLKKKPSCVFEAFLMDLCGAQPLCRWENHSLSARQIRALQLAVQFPPW